MRTSVPIVIALIAVACTATPRAALSDWPVFGHDEARSGYAGDDTAISLSNVHKLHRRWVATLDAPADSAPILISKVRWPGGRELTMLFETTRDGTTYGVNAFTGAIIWSHSTQGPNITNSMPASDGAGQVIFAPGVDGFVHKLSAVSGQEFRDGVFPVRITWMPEIEKNASALNVANGFLYAVTSGYFGDHGHYVGHLVTVGLKDRRVRVFNALCSKVFKLLRYENGGPSCPQARAGIWARAGAVVDPDPSMHGRVYVTTGNGPFTAGNGGDDYGDSVLAISADGTTLEDSFTPTDFDQLEAGDVDLGSTAPAMLPRQSSSRTPLMAVQGGKDGILRLLNRRHLGGVGGEIFDFDLGVGVFSAPAVWRDARGLTWIYVGTSSGVTALQIRTDASGKSALRQRWTATPSATSPVVVNGVVFITTNSAVDALDARTGKLVWWSGSPSAGGTIEGVHWQSPIVVNGWVYVSDEAGHLIAYSLTTQ